MDASKKFISDEQITTAGAKHLKALHLPSSPPGHAFDSVRSPGSATPTSLVFISTPEMLAQALSFNAHGFIVLEKSFPQLKALIPETSAIWTTGNIQQAMTSVLPLFDRKNLAYPQPGIHPTAVIDPTAQISPTAHVGPYVVVQRNVKIGDAAVLGAHSVVEAFATIGEKSLLTAHVFVGSFCHVGQRCIIAPHVTIGSDGFGYFTDKNGHHKIPQIGNVVIEDDCEIGGNCVIDRATLESTIIRRGSKLDNLCHIAHNVEIGENALLTGAFKTAGSSKFGKNLMTGGNVDINGHIEICDNVILAARTGVIHSIKQPGMYGGFPAEPQRDNIKTMVSLSHLVRIRKNVQRIMKHLQLEDSKE